MNESHCIHCKDELGVSETSYGGRILLCLNSMCPRFMLYTISKEQMAQMLVELDPKTKLT